MRHGVPVLLLTASVLDDLYRALIQFQASPSNLYHTLLWSNLSGDAAVVADMILEANQGQVPICPGWPEAVGKFSTHHTFMYWCVWMGRTHTDFSGSRRRVLLLLFNLGLLPKEVPTT